MATIRVLVLTGLSQCSSEDAGERTAASQEPADGEGRGESDDGDDQELELGDNGDRAEGGAEQDDDWRVDHVGGVGSSPQRAGE